MKSISTNELETISSGIAGTARKMNLAEVEISDRIWPVGDDASRADDAIRLVNYGAFRAAITNGDPVFEESDPAGFGDLLAAYGADGNNPQT